MEAKKDLQQLLADLEPWCYTVGDLPVVSIQYWENSVKIEWMSRLEFEEYKRTKREFLGEDE